MSNSSLFTPALLRTHSFVFCAVHDSVATLSVVPRKGIQWCAGTCRKDSLIAGATRNWQAAEEQLVMLNEQ